MIPSQEPKRGGEHPPDDTESAQQDATPDAPEASGDDSSDSGDGRDDGASENNAPDAETSRGAPPEASSQPSDEDFEDELPEWEPLTPELVEDEAIRGDFMLRWAVVLLAFLLACTPIAESQTLVHVKSGQYIAAHGWLPPRTDVFSYTATDRPWINLSWLLDLILAGVYSVGSHVGLDGAVGLSLLKAVVAALTFGLILHVSRRGVSTWWGSICAALALVSCYPQFTARPEMMTLLGLAVTLWLLHRWRETGNSRSLWLLPGVFLLWSNFDPRMFLGLSLLLLYGAGEGVGHLLGRSGFSDATQRKRFWGVVGACVIAALVNPFGWHSLTAPVSLYGVEYPALRVHYGASTSAAALANFPMTAAVFWSSLNHELVAGLLVLTAALIAMLLNRRQVAPAHVGVFVGFAGFAVAAGHELAAAGLVVCVLATLNAQDWYRANFRQTYSVELRELLFSRGGRAVTVLVLFAVAYLAISGWLDGPNGRRTGLGLHAGLQARIDGLRSELKDSFDDRPFNFRFRQGDVLIWIGQRPFVDHRVALYHGSGAADLLERHDFTRRALRKSRGNGSDAEHRDVWSQTFNQYRVTHVVPRLSEPNPDYVTYFDLLTSPDDWEFTELGSAGAVFYRKDLDDPRLKAYLADHRVDFRKQAFRTEGPAPLPRDWARSKSVYEKYLSLPQTEQPNAIQRAMHYQAHLRNAAGYDVSEAAALAYLMIRAVNQGLAEDPQSAVGYRLLGEAYYILGQLEGRIVPTSNGTFSGRRFIQIVQAYRQALLIEPDDRPTNRVLADVFYRQHKHDLALESLERYRDLTTERAVLSEAEIRDQTQIEQLRTQLKDESVRVTSHIDEQLGQGTDRLAIARTAYQAGYVLKALELLNEASESVAQNVQVQLFQARLLMEAGRARDAFETVAPIESVADRYPGLLWRSPAALAGLANGRYERAVDLWTTEADKLQQQGMTSFLQTMPLTEAPGRWPQFQIQASVSALYQQPVDLSDRLFNVALCHLESGRPKAAETVLQRVLDTDPETPLRPLVRFYLYMISDELIDLEPPSDWIPVSPELFAPGRPAEAQSRLKPVDAEKPGRIDPAVRGH